MAYFTHKLRWIYWNDNKILYTLLFIAMETTNKFLDAVEILMAKQFFIFNTELWYFDCVYL